MGQVLQFPAIRLTPPPEAVASAKEYAGKLRAAYLRRCMDNMVSNPGSPEYERLLIWAVDDFLRWYSA